MSNLSQIKKDIIGYVEKYVQIHKYKFKPLNTVNTLDELKKSRHYIFPYYEGQISYLVFFKKNDCYNAYLVDRFSMGKKNTDLLNIIPVKVRATNDVYDGTIVEGILVNAKLFIATDCFYYSGNSNIKKDLKIRMNDLSIFLDKNFDFKNKDNLVVKTQAIYSYVNLGELVYEIIPNLQYKVNGLLFYPKFGGQRISYKQTHTLRENTPKEKSFKNLEKDEDQNEITSAFLIKETKTPDLYNLYLKKNKKIILYGTASVPTIECSSFCRKIFKENKKSSNIVNCKLEKGEWKPIELLFERTEPDNYFDVLEIMNSNREYK